MNIYVDVQSATKNEDANVAQNIPGLTYSFYHIPLSTNQITRLIPNSARVDGVAYILTLSFLTYNTIPSE